MAVRLLINAVVNGQRQVEGLQASVTRLSASARLLQTALVGAFAVAGANALTRSVTEATDTVTQLQNQLTAAGVAAEGIAAAQADVVRLADQTRSSIEATGGLYARVLRSTRELGISQQQGLDISRAFQQTLQLSGASTSEAAAASLQFGQALASGRLQGDELRSILENNSFFAQRMAQELGVGVGQLREMGAQGELTSGLLAEIALQIAPEINSQFQDLTPTFAQAGTVLRNELLLATNELGQSFRRLLGDVVELGRSFGRGAGGAIRRFAAALDAVRENADGLRVAFTALATTITVILIPAILRLSVVLLTRLASAVLLILSPIATLVGAIAALVTAAILGRDQLGNVFSAIANRFSILGEQVGLFFEALPDRARIAAAGFAEGFVAGLDDVGEAIINALLIPINAIIEAANELGAGLDLLSVDIPEVTIDIDTEEAEGRLAALQSEIDDVNMRAEDASAEVGESLTAFVDEVVAAATMGVEAVQNVINAFGTAPEVPAGEPPAPMGAPAVNMEETENALLEGVRGIDVDRIGMDFEDNLEQGIERALNSGDFSSLGDVFLDSFTMSVNEQLAEQISGVFGNLWDTLTMESEDGTVDIVSNFSALFDQIGMLFSGGGGGFGSILGAVGGLFGFRDGGIVPGFQDGGIVPGPQSSGPDNTIVAARSGELILNRAQQENLANQLQSPGMQQTFNINVTGDVSRQTESIIMQMIPEIASGVNQQNLEMGAQ